MILTWSELHGTIFQETVTCLKEHNIRYFVLRNYEKLPNENTSKDVDIIIEPGKLMAAKSLLMEAYKNAGLKHYFETIFGRVHCMLGMDEERKISIHIDLIEGYLAKGFEIFTFDELYQHTMWYRGFCVMEPFYEGIMLYIYKQFGYMKPKLKQEYKECIFDTYQREPDQFRNVLSQLTDVNFAGNICNQIAQKDFDAVLQYAPKLTKKLRKYVWKKRPVKTVINTLDFFAQKLLRIVFCYRKYAKTFAVMAPDGTGKTTFLDSVLERLNFYYVNYPDEMRFHVYHFRPSILPNLGEVGEKAGVMKQDTDFTNPHRSKPANPLSSLVRIGYYTLDYILGWQKCVRSDVQYDRYTIFDRYSYDFIVDPLRTKLNLPMWVRKFFVALTPQPKIVFFLDASPEVVYARKQELSLEEIERQGKAYRELALSNPQKFKIINAEKTPDEMADQAVKILLDTFTEKF